MKRGGGHIKGSVWSRSL